MEWDVERIAGACGAIVRGVDLRRPQTAEETAALTALLDEHLVVALPDQFVDLDQLERATDELGGRDITPYVKPVDGRPYVIRVIKEPTDELNFANAWHTDLSYLPEPPSYTLLHAHDVPDFGGDTIWASQHAAFHTLPVELRERLIGMTATHSAGFAYGTGGYLDATADKSSMEIEPSADAYATETHPVVVAHPNTGRPALYVNSVYTQRLDGFDDEAEGRELLGRLVQHSTHPNLTCRLRWRNGMLAIWDNRAVQHLAINDYAGVRRELFRTSVKGTRPTPFS